MARFRPTRMKLKENPFYFLNHFIICKLIWIQFKFKFRRLLLAKIKYKNISSTKENYASTWNAIIKYLFKYVDYRILFFNIGERIIFHDSCFSSRSPLCIDIAYIYIYIYQCAASKLCHLIGWKKILYLTSEIHGFKKWTATTISCWTTHQWLGTDCYYICPKEYDESFGIQELNSWMSVSLLGILYLCCGWNQLELHIIKQELGVLRYG
jgi:hypothetical protein